MPSNTDHVFMTYNEYIEQVIEGGINMMYTVSLSLKGESLFYQEKVQILLNKTDCIKHTE